MKNTLMLSLFGVLCSIAGTSCADECAGLQTRALVEVQADIAGNEDRALREYFSERVENSVAPLEVLLQSYRAAHCSSEVTDELLSALKYDELLAHGRLARQYRRLGRDAKAAMHMEKGVALGRAVFQNKSWSEKDLRALIDDVDKKAHTAN